MDTRAGVPLPHRTLPGAGSVDGHAQRGLEIPDTPPRHLTPGNAQPPIHWLRGDAERLPVADNSLDLVFSSLAVQWCPTPATGWGSLRVH
ncbi:methyltransferase domain-containing protein [Cobetia marina]